ncbi:MAG: type II and III secretion system protein family protein [Methylobacter sp.]
MTKNTKKKLSCIFAIAASFAAHHALAAITSTGIRSDKVQVSLHKSRLITLDKNIAEISQGNPVVADFAIDEEAAEASFMPPNQLLIRGKSLGTTNLYLWSDNGKIIQALDIEVTHDLDSLKAQLYQLLPHEKIAARSSQRNIVLSGEVSTPAAMQAALDLAQSYLPLQRGGMGGGAVGGQGSQDAGQATGASASGSSGSSRANAPRVINLINVGGAQQVMLDVKIAEIDRKLIKGLNIKFSALQVSDAFSIGTVSGGGSANPLGIGGLLSPHSFNAAAVFLQAISGEFLFNLTIDAANDQQLAKILAQPTLTTLSGQAATFISGGEFPIPVPQGGAVGGGTITIQFKEFGIGLKFVPVVLDSGRINLNMNVSVSELSEDAAIIAQAGDTNTQFSIPSLTKREASSTLELADGQTMSIAGLISDKLRENVNKFPGLGDIPGLGALFRSSKFLNQQTELVIFVTPRLAKPVLAQNAQLPTDSFVPPDDVDFYVLGRTESRKVRNRWLKDDVNAVANKGGLDGEYGQQLMDRGQ